MPKHFKISESVYNSVMTGMLSVVVIGMHERTGYMSCMTGLGIYVCHGICIIMY